MIPAEAQMRGGMRGFAGVGRTAPIGTFRGGGRGAVPFRPIPARGLRGPAFPGFTPFHNRFSGFIGFNGFRNRGFFGFNHGRFFCDGFGRCFNARFFPRHRRFGFDTFGFGFGAFGGFPSIGAWGYPFYGGYYGDNGYDQGDYLQSQMAQNERLMNDLEYDRRRNLELQEQLAEQHAADAADAARARNAPAQSAQQREPERRLPPTVLIFRDHHQQEVTDYAIYGNTLLALDPNQRSRIPLSELDLPATVQANEARGLDFRVPGTSQPK